MQRLFPYVILLTAMVWVSCEKGETPVDRPQLETVQIPMGPQYSDEFYFDLETKEVVRSVAKLSWDLAFEASPEGYRVFINGGKLMFAYGSGSTQFDSTYTYNLLRRRWDEPTGELNKTAFGEWGTPSGTANTYTSTGQVYLVDRGINLDLQPIGYKKVVILGSTADSYTLAFGELNSTVADTVTIAKNSDYHKVYFSFDNSGQTVTVEPTKNSWDLSITNYTHVFYEPLPGFPPTDTLPYLVVGTLANYQSGVEVATIDSTTFNTITIDQVSSFTYSSLQNSIGYDWKSFSLNDENYTIDFNKAYLIKSVEGNYFKLRFTDFYEQGIKGYPTFDVQEVK